MPLIRPRLSDIACNLLKSFLIDYTIEQCEKIGLPRSETRVAEVLEQASNVLKESAPALGFNQFDPDQLPTVSDLNFVVSQFVECAEKVRCENIARNYDGVWYWKIGGKVSDVITSPPKGAR